MSKKSSLSFAERHPEAYASMALAMKDYSKYMNDFGTGTDAAEAAAAARSHSKIDLEHDDEGFPIIPDITDADVEDNLEHQKRLIRSYLTDHYRLYVCARSN